MTGPVLVVLSLGAGVQSTALALMAAHGEIEAPDCAIFADTGCEPRPVYEHLRWLVSGNVLPFPVHVVSAGSLVAEVYGAVAGDNKSHGRPPFFVRSPSRQLPALFGAEDLFPGDEMVTVAGGMGMIRRQCTGDYKIDPIRRKCRELVGLGPRQRMPRGIWIEQIVGISWDERKRAKHPAEAWIEATWPLIERKMTRGDCLGWMARHGYPVPPRSACTICPMRKNTEWRWLRDNDPEGWNEAVAVDRAIRNGMKNLKAEEVYLHRDGMPLEDVDLTTAADFHDDLFAGECAGVCGV